ncbi:hypothetical protein EON71_00985 [bacterium]|nr:MAG: hypothetical protein EON71_00985 [bacterium]
MWEPAIRENMLNALNHTRVAKNLPSNIYERKIKGELTGYEVKIKINNVLTRKWFSSKKFTPEQNLCNAKQYLDTLLKSLQVITV